MSAGHASLLELSPFIHCYFSVLLCAETQASRLRVTKMGSVAATISWLVAAVSRSAQLAYRAPAVQLNWGKRSSAAAVYSTLWQTVNNLSGLLHVTGRQFVACLTSCMSYFLAMPGTFSVALRCEHAWVCICMLGILTFVMFAGG